MSDEIPAADVFDVQQQRMQKLWLCSELWTDVFKMLSRRDLVQRVQPVHRRFKEICDENVDSVHLIRDCDRLIDGLAKNLPEANEQYAQLAASNCPLEPHFRLVQMDIWVCRRPAETNAASYKRRRRYQMCVVRHSLDLFRGACVHLYLPDQKGLMSPADSTECLAYLNILHPLCPVYIELASLCSSAPLQMDELFRQPAILNCTRLTMLQAAKNEPGAATIVDWLHFCPTAAAESVIPAGKEELIPTKDEDDDAFGHVRCLNIPNSPMANSIEEVLDRCIHNLNLAGQQQQHSSDRRAYLLNFCFPDRELSDFRVENVASGEMLMLTNVKTEAGLRSTYYRLRRCLAREAASDQQMERFEQKMFRAFGKFRFDAQPGEPPLVTIT